MKVERDSCLALKARSVFGSHQRLLHTIRKHAGQMPVTADFFQATVIRNYSKQSHERLSEPQSKRKATECRISSRTSTALSSHTVEVKQGAKKNRPVGPVFEKGKSICDQGRILCEKMQLLELSPKIRRAACRETRRATVGPESMPTLKPSGSEGRKERTVLGKRLRPTRSTCLVPAKRFKNPHYGQDPRAEQTKKILFPPLGKLMNV